MLALLVILGPTLARVVLGWRQPLGPALGLPTLTPTVVEATDTPAATSVALASHVTPAAASTATPAPMCGAPPVMNILAIGSDTRADNYLYGLADVSRVVRVDFTTPKVTALDMPRDMWVEVPGIADHRGITHSKLNQSFFYGSPGMGYYDGPGEGAGLLARTLDLNFGLRVDHYLTVNMQTFVRFVDAIGGVDVYLAQDVDGTPPDDKTEDMGYYTAGQHHFDGLTALRFARIRKRYTVFKRAEYQNLVLCAIRKKVLGPAIITRLPQIATTFQNSIQTDLTPEQIGQLMCVAPQVSRDNLNMESLPETLLTGGRAEANWLESGTTFVWYWDEAGVRQVVSDFMAGHWPPPDDEHGPTCPEESPAPTATP